MIPSAAQGGFASQTSFASNSQNGSHKRLLRGEKTLKTLGNFFDYTRTKKIKQDLKLPLPCECEGLTVYSSSRGPSCTALVSPLAAGLVWFKMLKAC